ncbi:MAG: transglycosylase SLT domain-containing protein [Candidatus Aminicenantes bacterium]|nr:transglycosylase SLT domain-containing protein [Candidatus Aminicenantes bacterium]
MPKYVDLIEKHFPEKERSTALAVLTAESSGDSNSHRKNKWENSYGLFQINYKIWEKTLKEAGIIKDAKDLLDPETNIKAAAHILSVSNRGWGEWTGTFGKNLHKQFIPEK